MHHVPLPAASHCCCTSIDLLHTFSLLECLYCLISPSFSSSLVVQWLGYMTFTHETRVQFPAGEASIFFSGVFFLRFFLPLHHKYQVCRMSAYDTKTTLFTRCFSTRFWRISGALNKPWLVTDSEISRLFSLPHCCLTL